MVSPARLVQITVIYLLWFIGPGVSYAEKTVTTEGISLAVIVSGDNREYQTVADSFTAYLEHRGIQASNISTITPDTLAVQNKGSYDLIVAIGTPASRAAASHGGNTPTLCIFIPRKNFTKLPFGAQQDVASIVIDQPLSRYLRLSAAIFQAGDKNLGIFYNGQDQVRDLLFRLIRNEHFTPVLKALDSPLTARDITTLLDSSDVIQLLPGMAEITPQRAKWLLYMAYRERVPVIAFSESYVKSGALAAISTSPDAIGRQAAEHVLQVLNAPGPITLQQERFGRINYPTTFSVHINRKIAELLGIDVADSELLKQRIDRAVSNDTSDTTHAN